MATADYTPTHTRIQATGTTANRIADTLHKVANLIEEGTTSGYVHDAYNFRPVTTTTPVQPIFGPARPSALIEIDETTPERTAFTLRVIADQIADGFTPGTDSHSEGSYSFSTTNL